MIIKWSRNQFIILTLVVVLGILVYVLGYQLYLKPIVTKVDAATQRLEIQENVLENALEDQKAIDQDVTTDLQKKLPVQKALDQLLLIVNNIAKTTDNSIVNITSVETVLDEKAEDKTQNMITVEGIEKIQYEMEVLATGYLSMHAFISELENASRIISTEHLEFRQSPEQLLFHVTFTAYYSPQLDKLQSEAPSFDFIAPANKEAPF